MFRGSFNETWISKERELLMMMKTREKQRILEIIPQRTQQEEFCWKFTPRKIYARECVLETSTIYESMCVWNTHQG